MSELTTLSNMATYGDPPTLVPLIPTPTKRSKKSPQEVLSDFWDKFHSKYPGKVTSIFPRALYSSLLPAFQEKGASSTRNAQESYDAAARECREKVKRIIRECERTNEKYTDADFDIERDSKSNCLNGLIRDWEQGASGGGGAAEDGPNVSSWDVKNSLDTLNAAQILGPSSTIPIDPTAVSRFLGGDGGGGWNPFANAAAGKGARAASDRVSKRHGVRGSEYYSPGSIHRIDWIFDSPQFTLNGYSSSDIKQGANGDCWWLAAVATIAHRKDLMEKVCVARDEECGVYGFVFQRDGEWISTVIDDNLYLKESDFDYYGDVYDASGKKARQHRKRLQTGSDALYFARCEDQNETWLPLLEKAYAKVHGDYEAISGGWPGEAVEDMTGGVTSTIATNRVLRKDRLWKELISADGEFVFALAAMGTGWDWQKSGLALGHAYSILQSREEVDEDGKKVRLVQIRNPWGERSDGGVGEWNGPWSDGSKQWTPYWLKRLNHTFGDDGVFWMSYQDMLSTFMYIHRTRIFDEKWTVVQQWTSSNISWVTGFLQTKFVVKVKKSGMVVIVLTQLDDRYFHGFEGQYWFELHFVLQQAGSSTSSASEKSKDEEKKKTDAPEPEQICRVRPVHKWENRSVSCEVDLEPGIYEVLPKVTAARNSDGDGSTKPVEDVVKEYAERNPQKLRQVGLQYDIAHAKGGVRDEDELVEKKKLDAKQKKESKKAKKRRRQKKALGIAAKALEDSAKVVSDLANEGKKTEEKKESKDTAEKEGKKAEEKEQKKDGDSTETKSSEKDSTGSSLKPTEAEKPASLTASKPGDGPTQEPKKGEEKDSEEKVDKKESEKKSEESKPAEETVATKSKAEDDSEEAPAEEEEASDSDSDAESTVLDDNEELTGTPWNAVCVLGLRVYARDPEVSIKLVKPSDAEEASSLIVDGEAAGATA
ncbi:calpain family cysteine protease [Colletotrichum orchidophilum]|uniref:Calpain family cysteine protease n=1 Tax=Colletotrichum orchidophilum TaxID=1209926 RepID=A0A1G4AWC2_9PEZI|nr:calpain family cysteine protease [Colletotrichum orchidophilum]OHE93421.1 calpain family cysteine protease [Colletotrichum orchidophilum]